MFTITYDGHLFRFDCSWIGLFVLVFALCCWCARGAVRNIHVDNSSGRKDEP